MAKPDDFLSYSDLWASLVNWSDTRKKAVFEQIVERMSSFSKESITNVLEGLGAPYKKVVWELWLAKCDLSRYSLLEMRDLVRDSDAEYIGVLWQRWLTQRDLSNISLIAFSKVVSDLAPQLQAQCLQSFVKNCPNIGMYGIKEWEKVKTVLTSYAVKSVHNTESAPTYAAQMVVRVKGMPYTSRVEAVVSSNGAWKYRLRDETRYFEEHEIEKV